MAVEGISTLLKSRSRQETIDFGKKLGNKLMPGDVLALSGSLGSGKTTFVKGIASGLGVQDEHVVKSPTYVLMHIYRARYPIYHLDLFRLETCDEVENLGWDDILAGDGIVLIEWATKIKGYLPKDYLEVSFKVTGEVERDILYKALGCHYEEMIQALSPKL